MEERRNLPSLRVDSRQVRAFVQIAAVACQREIAGIVGAAVLLRRDVLDMVLQAAMFLVQPAVLTPLPGPLPDEVPHRRIHLLLNLRGQVQPGFELEDRDEIRRVDQRFVFGAFTIAQRALVGPLSERIDSLLNRLRDLQIDDPACRCNVETPA
jgi:hypothetical protein